jgi:hypothetical protein
MFSIRLRRRALIILSLVLLTSVVVAHAPLWAQRSIDVRSDRWLRVKAVSGSVEFFTANTSAAAQVGDLLTAPGDGVRTGQNSSCVLEVDTGVGTITLNENTELAVRRLDFAADNGQITRLTVPYGNVVLNLRRFTHRGSELEIETPTGVSGVRGTEFGIVVHPNDSRTAIATASGAVYAAAEGTTVNVNDGLQTLIRPGDAPLPPKPIPPEPIFDYQISSTIRNRVRYLVLLGRIDPINQVYVEDELQDVTPAGEFRYESLAYHGASLRVRIVTPLGDVTTYDIALL